MDLGRRCEHCMSMFQQPRLTCEDLFDCVTHGGTLFAMSQEGGLGWEADVLCLPTMNSNNTDMRAIVFATGRFTATTCWIFIVLGSMYGFIYDYMKYVPGFTIYPQKNSKAKHLLVLSNNLNSL